MWNHSECVRDMIKIYSQMHRTDKYSQHSSIISVAVTILSSSSNLTEITFAVLENLVMLKFVLLYLEF